MVTNSPSYTSMLIFSTPSPFLYFFSMPVELYGVIMEYPLTAGPVLSLILIIPTVLILFLMRKYINADNLSQGYGMK